MYRLASKGLKSWPETKTDFSLKLYVSKYSCRPHPFQSKVCSYTVRRTQYNRLSQQQLSFLFFCTVGTQIDNLTEEARTAQ